MLRMASHKGIQTRKLLGSNFFRGDEQNLKQVKRIYLELETGIIKNHSSGIHGDPQKINRFQKHFWGGGTSIALTAGQGGPCSP